MGAFVDARSRVAFRLAASDSTPVRAPSQHISEAKAGKLKQKKYSTFDPLDPELRRQSITNGAHP